MYRYFDKATEPDGDLAVGVVLDICTDVEGTLATIYSDNTSPPSGRTNPYTVGASGYVDFWAYEPILYWRVSGTDDTPLPIARIAGREDDVFNVKDFGAVGDDVTDDTDAFLAAIAAQKAQFEATYDIAQGWHRFLVWPIYIPPGNYRVRSGEMKIDYRGAIIKGAGRNATFICTLDAYDDDPVFEVGYYPFTTDPVGDHPDNEGEWWCGSLAQNSEFHDMTITRPATDYWWNSQNANRAGVGIQDNGAGGMTTWNVTIRGFEYGFASPYGHDFGYHYNLEIMCCDVGLYLACGSEQCQFYGLNVGLCNENIVFEQVENIMIYGVNTSTPVNNSNVSYEPHDITFISHYDGTNPTRMGVTGLGWGACRNISIYNLWEERVFDMTTQEWWDATAISSYIHFAGDNPAKQIQFYDPLISARLFANEPTPTGSFSWMDWEASTGQNACTVTIYNPWMHGHDLFDAWFAFDNTKPSYFYVRLENPVVAGVDVDHLPFWEGWGAGVAPPVGLEIAMRDMPDSVGATTINQTYSNRINMLGHNKYGLQLSGATGYHLDLSYIHQGTPTLTPGFGFYPIGNPGVTTATPILCWGDCTSARTRGILFASAAPTSGTWVKGDIVFNSDPASTEYVGWICVDAAGSGTWKGFGTIAS